MNIIYTATDIETLPESLRGSPGSKLEISSLQIFKDIFLDIMGLRDGIRASADKLFGNIGTTKINEHVHVIH